jgi:hypothetical protein
MILNRIVIPMKCGPSPYGRHREEATHVIVGITGRKGGVLAVRNTAPGMWDSTGKTQGALMLLILCHKGLSHTTDTTVGRSSCTRKGRTLNTVLLGKWIPNSYLDHISNSQRRGRRKGPTLLLLGDDTT